MLAWGATDAVAVYGALGGSSITYPHIVSRH